MKKLISIVTLACATFAFAADQEENTSFDGLVEVERGAFQRVWIDPTIDLSFYTKILPGGASFDYRAVRPVSRTQAGRNSSRNRDGFPIEDRDRERLEALADEVFDAELQTSKHWTIVEEQGEDVLVARGALLDIMSRVPPQTIGRTDFYLSSVGEATLVLELVDSTSGEVLVRAAERRAAQQPGGNMNMVRMTSAGNWAEVRRLLQNWARTFVKGIDSIHTPAAE